MSKLPALAAGLLLGPVVGSFVTNWALRHARGEQALSGPSRCEHCGRSLGFAQTTPLISFVWLGGRCSGCGGAIDPLHPAGELAGALVAVLALTAPTPWEAALRIAVGFCLLALVIVDLKSLRLPNALTLATIVGCAAIALMRGKLLEGLAAAAVTGGLFAILRSQIRRGDTPGMGFGDVKLATGLSLWLGSASAWMIVLGCAMGIATHLVLRPADRRAPFGPALALAALVVATLRDRSELGMWI